MAATSSSFKKAEASKYIAAFLKQINFATQLTEALHNFKFCSKAAQKMSGSIKDKPIWQTIVNELTNSYEGNKDLVVLQNHSIDTSNNTILLNNHIGTALELLLRTEEVSKELLSLIYPDTKEFSDMCICDLQIHFESLKLTLPSDQLVGCVSARQNDNFSVPSV